MGNIGKYFLAGVAVVVAIKVFWFQNAAADRIIAQVKTKQPEQIVFAAAITVVLGMLTVIVAQAFRRAS